MALAENRCARSISRRVRSIASQARRSASVGLSWCHGDMVSLEGFPRTILTTTVVAVHGRCRAKVEPGGFAPPCRNVSPTASTSVSVISISPRPSADSGRQTSASLTVVSFRGGKASLWNQPSFLRWQTLPGVGSTPRHRELGGESVLRVGSSSFASFLRGLDAPRLATMDKVRPVDAGRPLM